MAGLINLWSDQSIFVTGSGKIDLITQICKLRYWHFCALIEFLSVQIITIFDQSDKCQAIANYGLTF